MGWEEAKINCKWFFPNIAATSRTNEEAAEQRWVKIAKILEEIAIKEWEIILHILAKYKPVCHMLCVTEQMAQYKDNKIDKKSYYYINTNVCRDIRAHESIW